MRVLIIGGTGLISTGIVEELLQRGDSVTLFNRGQRAHALPNTVNVLIGDRNRPAEFEERLNSERFDVVIDMICFTPQQAEATIRAFAGRCAQVQFCSTVCTYGSEISESALVDERFPQRPLIPYAKDKVACEQLFRRAHEQGKFNATIVRPSNTYGPGASLIDQMEFDSAVWDRVAHGLPVLCANDGLGLWQSTHRRDVGRFFAYACGNQATYGEDFNVVHDRTFTWRDYYREAAAALGTTAELYFVPAAWIIRKNPKRFAFLAEISRFHGAYTNGKAKRAVPQFAPSVTFVDGARETFADIRRRDAWRSHLADTEYTSLIAAAEAAGFERATA